MTIDGRHDLTALHITFSQTKKLHEMKKLLTVICASAALAVQAAGYHVIATLPDDTDGAMAYICDYDSNPIDSAYVSDCKAVFDGYIRTLFS